MSMKGNLSKAPEHYGEVPTKLSELENDAGYAKLNSEGDFTVPGKLHAKEIDAHEDAAHLCGDWQVDEPANEKSIANRKFVEEIIKRIATPEDDPNSKCIGGLTIESILLDEESDYYSTSMAAKGMLLISGSSGVMLQGNESVFIIAPVDMSITAGSMVIDAQSLLIGKNGASEPINLELVYGSSITGLVDPTDDSGAVNKGYVDTILRSLKPARIANVTLNASDWEQGSEDSLFSQKVDIEGITEYSQVDLTPSVEQLAIFYNKDLAFVTENDNGVVTVYAIGQKPLNDYTIQATITEVTA